MPRDLLLEYGSLYWDSQFPPCLKSLFIDGKIPPEITYAYRIVWRRPRQIVADPKFVVGGFSRHDLIQGMLGNCWFISAVAVLVTTNKYRFSKVVPYGQGFAKDKYLGFFKFNFWWYGNWTEVIIDDYLPTVDQKLIYANNTQRPNEFWPCLLEKAYAKLRGCYELLDGGKLQDAMVDLTGGISEVIDIRDKTKISPELYSLLLKSFKMRTLMGAIMNAPADSVKREIRLPNGLYTDHAYSITDLRQIHTGKGIINLMRLRNPWGNEEWTGAWSDKSDEMQKLPQPLHKYLRFTEKEEGEFWMAYEDVIANFEHILLCHFQPDAMIAELADNDERQLWHITVYHDSWIRGVSAGGCGNAPDEDLYWKNPQFYVTFETPDLILGHGNDCTMIVSLMEKERDKRAKISVAFKVYELKSPDLRPLDNSRVPKDALLLSYGSGSYKYYREVTRRLEVKPGTYVIIPSAFYPNDEADFMLRIYTETICTSGILEKKVEQAPRMTFNKHFVRDAFQRHAGADEKMDAFELQTFLEDLSTSELGDPLKFPIETCRSLITLMDEDRSGFLSFNEVKQAWEEVKSYKDVFKEFDVYGTNSVETYELGTMFSKLGLPVDRNVLTSIIRRYGGRNIQISFADFVMVVCKLESVFESFSEHQKKNGGLDTVEFTINEFLEVTMFI